MNLELGPILDVFPNASKDARRIGLFVTACQKKAIELVMSNGDYQGFVQEVFAVSMKFSPRKFSFADLFRDPYKGAREAIRVFGEKWQLDPLFLKEMG
jgi:hypothetical protein